MAPLFSGQGHLRKIPLDLAPAAEQDPGLIAKTKSLLDALARNQVSIYPVDVRRLLVIPPGFVMLFQREFDAMDQIAKLTGGMLSTVTTV